MNYNEYYEDSYYYENENTKIELPKYSSAKEALENVLEELYSSINGINKKKLRDDLAFLCNELKLNTDLLNDEESLCVEHYKEKYKYEERQKNKHDSIIKNIKKNAFVLKEQLCGKGILDKKIVKESLAKICWETSCPLSYLDEVHVSREIPDFLYYN